jgi:class 3 adenylate cyclase/putative methionine-R-sulfoxide reductase with GAF domain
MAVLDQQYIAERCIGRREEDWLARTRIDQFDQFVNVGQTITSEMNMDALFDVIMDQTNQIMGTKRSTVFLYDEKHEELWSLVATSMKKNEIRVPANGGVAGWVFQNNIPLLLNDAYDDPRFYSEVDKATGFRTKNILCVPLVNRKGQNIGVLQVLNKNLGNFTDEDKKLLTSISHYVAIALENSKLYEEIKNYSEELKATLIRIETIEKVKSQLTKFVPSSVAKLAEHNSDELTGKKIPMDVSILFIDIQGFSKITEKFDQTLVNDMVECHFSSYLECINRHGGEVNETSGDGLMVIFKNGSLESHARQAVAAGLEIVFENGRLNYERSYPWGRVKLRLGVNSGVAWVGSTKMKSFTGERWTYTASGLVTILAARIAALSRASQLFVGPETFKCIECDSDYECIGLQKVKNVNNPIPVYWVKHLK